ncbi:MAG: hypothetical protein RR946_08585 [Clostridia bacterium]
MKGQDTEIREAIQAAAQTLEHLNRARECLNSAGNWGIVDMLGGGFFSTLMKRGKMGNAEQEMMQARQAMRSFAAELRDVQNASKLHIELNDFVGFADYFFDGMIADWMVQSRIGAAKEQVAEAIRKVQKVRNDLQGLL